MKCNPCWDRDTFYKLRGWVHMLYLFVCTCVESGCLLARMTNEAINALSLEVEYILDDGALENCFV